MRALVLDFDGLILDTETAVFGAWQHVFESFDLTFDRAEWLNGIGTDSQNFDPMDQLRSHTGGSLDPDAIHARRRNWVESFLEELDPMPGVRQLLEDAARLNLSTAVASSSPRDWVEPHLRRIGLEHHFEAIVTRDDVDRAKPHPDLYLRALDRLGAGAGEAIAIEDSENGVTAARAAGMACVAVPGPMTLEMDFSHASLVLPTLADQTLASLIDQLRPATSSRL